MTTIIQWLRTVLGYAEPVRARAVAMAAVGLVAALGLTTQTGLPGWVDTLLIAYTGLWPLIQGWLTRPKVTSAAKVDLALTGRYRTGAVGPELYDQLRAELVTGGKAALCPG